jgi:hypothetical protein
MAGACGRSVVVARKPSKLQGRVQFPSPAWSRSRARLRVQQSRGVAQSGSAPGWGPGGRRFKSCLPDYGKASHRAKNCGYLGGERSSTGNKRGTISRTTCKSVAILPGTPAGVPGWPIGCEARAIGSDHSSEGQVPAAATFRRVAARTAGPPRLHRRGKSSSQATALSRVTVTSSTMVGAAVLIYSASLPSGWGWWVRLRDRARRVLGRSGRCG